MSAPETIGDYAVHPLSSLFPNMPDDEMSALAADIEAHGLQRPIVLDQEGRLVDGRQRLRACIRAAVEPTFETKHINDDVEVAAYLYAANVLRRHLNTVQSAVAAARYQECVLREHAVANQHRGGELPQNVAGGDTRKIAAALFGSNHRYVDIARNALKVEPRIGNFVDAGLIDTVEMLAKIARLSPKDRAAVMHVVENGRPVTANGETEVVKMTPKEVFAHLARVGKTAVHRKSGSVNCGVGDVAANVMNAMRHCPCESCRIFQQGALGVPEVAVSHRAGRIEILVRFNPDAALELTDEEAA